MGAKILINAISYYEVKRELLAVSATRKLEKFENFCENFSLALLDSKDIFDKSAQIYADLKKKGKLIKDADILIASTVISKNSILVSNDTDFSKI
ncbi:hypothetical protein HRbin19_01733 [bacterium HR19]|nr:hypothetical protein HRbin19_01733 [bacterium HR19]